MPDARDSRVPAGAGDASPRLLVAVATRFLELGVRVSLLLLLLLLRLLGLLTVRSVSSFLGSLRDMRDRLRRPDLGVEALAVRPPWFCDLTGLTRDGLIMTSSRSSESFP